MIGEEKDGWTPHHGEDKTLVPMYMHPVKTPDNYSQHVPEYSTNGIRKKYN